MKKKLRSRHSLRYSFLRGTSIVLIPFILAIIFSNIYSTYIATDYVKESYQRMIALYMNQIDSSLSAANATISNMAVSDINLQVMGYTDDEIQQYFSKYSVMSEMSNELSVYNMIYGMFVYTKSNKIFLEQFQPTVQYSEKAAIKNYIVKHSSTTEDLTNKEWDVVQIKDKSYLVNSFVYNGNVVAACISIDDVLQKLTDIDNGEGGFFIFTDADFRPLNGQSRIAQEHIKIDHSGGSFKISGSSSGYLALNKKSSISNIHLLALYPKKKIYRSFEAMIDLSVVMCLLIILILPLGLYFMNKLFIIPMRNLTIGMKKLGHGDFDYRLEMQAPYDEMKLITDTFNRMTAQINRLKIDVYEQEVFRQKAQLQYRQLQIRPHFLYNSISVMCSLAQQRKYELIQELSMSLVSYFRYMLRDGAKFVKITDELNHINNYLKIHLLRFPDTLKIVQYIGSGLEQFEIPPLIIHTFIENTIKHALVMGETITITLSIARYVSENPQYGGDRVKIIVSDTGRGFSGQVLDKLQHLYAADAFSDDHIGLQNIMQRIALLYGDTAYLKFYNSDQGGACNELDLPLNHSNEG